MRCNRTEAWRKKLPRHPVPVALLGCLAASQTLPVVTIVVDGDIFRLGASRLAAEGITFKQIPYDVKTR